MDTNRLKRFATEARNILVQGVAHRFTALGFQPDGTVTEEPLQQGGGATFMGDTVSQDFFDKWQSLRAAVRQHGIKEVAEEAAYTWFNRLVAIRIMVKNGLMAPVLQYEAERVHVPLLVSEARQGRLPEMSSDEQRRLTDLLDDDSKTAEQFRILIVALCHTVPVINRCFGHISDYTELLLPTNILADGGFIDMMNETEFIAEEDYRSPELIGWLYQFYIAEKKDDVFASFKKGKKAEAEDIPAATQIFTPNWIVKYMVQNTIGRIYLDNNPYEEEIQKNWKYLVEPSEPTPQENILHYDDLKELKFGDLACGSGHILNEGFDILYDLYILEGYSRRAAIENIFKYNLTGVDIDTRAKQLAQFALLLKACQKDRSFADAHIMPRVLDMSGLVPPHYDNLRDTLPHFFLGGNQRIVQEVIDAVELMKDAHNLGSIMKFNISPETRMAIVESMNRWESEGKEDFEGLFPAMKMILALTQKYSALVMNPPYMGAANMNNELKVYLEKEYPIGKSDLMTTFMLVSMNLSIQNGLWAMINLPSWMFIASYQSLREQIIEKQHILTLINNGRGIFGSDFGSVCFVIQNCAYRAKGCYRKLYKKHVNVRSVEKIKELFLNDSFGYYDTYQDYFKGIPGWTFGFWASKKTIDLYRGKQIKDIALFKRGLGTGDNNRFLRYWYEVPVRKIDIAPCATTQRKKWQKFNKGGDFHKWYGNRDYIINWENEGYDVCNNFLPNGKLASRPQNLQYNYKLNISYSSLTIGKPSFRKYEDFLNDQAGNFFIVNNMADYDCLFALFNSCLLEYFKEIKNNTVNITAEDLTTIPFLPQNTVDISNRVKECVYISQCDWDAHETSWDFDRNELLKMDEDVLFKNIDYSIEKHFKETGEHICIDPAAPRPESVKWCYDTYCGKWERLFMQLHENEEELNRQFIEIYGLQDELTPDVPLDEITILQQGEASIEDGQLTFHADVVMKQLISYAVGCMMGRYSIDKPGLILANQGDGLKEYQEQVPDSRFEVDDDGIIPLMSANTEFTDNATLRFKQWLTTAFGAETLVENLNFIEASLGKSLDDYFVKDFWKDHKKMYQNRPIYWLFSSKKGAFLCLAYMHRMDAYTAERIRTKYLLPHIEWLIQKQADMEANAANLNTRERKELDNITKQIAECREYHDRLHVVADEQIAFDLDDGVVVNYAKFGDVLAKIK